MLGRKDASLDPRMYVWTLPRRTFVTHGEPLASDVLRYRIQRDLGWNVEVPGYRDSVELSDTSV